MDRKRESPQNPRASHYRRSGFWGQVTATPVEPSKPRPKVPTILIASSSELEEDRDELTAYLAMNPALMVVRWAGFLDAMSGTDIEQNIEALRDCDIFVGLFSTNVGRFVGQEFDAALREFRDKKRPHIFVYFKDADVKIHRDDLTLLMALQGKLSHLHHFWQTYKSIDHLKLQLRRELERLVEERPDRFLDTL